MGADLYIRSVYDTQRAKYEGHFLHWVAVRDSVPDAAEKAYAQDQVAMYYDKLFTRGYFRDSYNSTNLLWLFELDWWDDVGRLFDAAHQLTPAGAQTVLAMLAEQEPTFAHNVEQTTPATRRYFRAKYRALQAFLREAIARNEPVECSV